MDLLTPGTDVEGYVIDGDRVSGEYCDLYPSGVKMLKVVPSEFSGLATNELVTLSVLRANDKFAPFLPKPVNSFSYGEDWINVFERLDGWFTMQQVREAYPDGVDPRDAAWMFRRLLAVLGHSHQQGYVHYSVVPPNVMILPDQHGLVLLGWGVSVPPDEVNKPQIHQAIGWENWYPYRQADTRLDIQMASKMVAYLLGGDPVAGTVPGKTPREFRIFLTGCSELSRSQVDAWSIQELFNRMIERLYGPRKFRPFSMPQTK